MAYYVPQVRVFQEFASLAAATIQPLNAFVCGENYHLFRYSVATEKAQIALGSYNKSTGVAAAWPNRPAGSVVDQSWTRVFFDNAWLEYFRDLNGATYSIKPVTGYPNRITCPTLSFATYGSYPRSAVFKERDVKVGDGVLLRYSACGSNFTVKTKVSGLINDVVPAVIHAATDDANNAPATSQTQSMTQTVGATTVGFSANGALYDGVADGYTIESYYQTVTTGGDFGAAQLTVVSGSGTDNMVDPIIPLDGVAISIGSRGLKTTFSTSGSATPFVLGQVYRIDVNQLWVPATPVTDTGATYTGTKNGTYIITVTSGGVWADQPTVFVSSTGTLDSSGPYAVAFDSYITLPTGVRIKFNGASVTGLVKNDKYYVQVNASTAGAIHTLQLQNSLADSAFNICGGSGSSTPTPVTLDVSLDIIKNIEVQQTRSGLIPNWTTTATEIDILPGITTVDASWHDSLGVLLSLDVIDGLIYSQYRSTRIAYQGTIGSTANISEVETLLGPAVSDNPLSLGVYKAVQNSNGSSVYFMATKDGTLESFNTVLAAIYDRDDIYGIVPLTHDKNVLDAVKASVLEASTGERGRWRVMWAGAQITDETGVVTRDSYGDYFYGTILDDPDTVGTQYTRLRCDAATFIDSGVVAGETVRCNFYTDPTTGVEAYEEFVIDAVLTQEEIRLATGPTIPVTIPSRFEIWKTNSNTDKAQQVIDFAGSLRHYRVRVVFPDKLGNGGDVLDSMFACAALAGLRSGVWPHQPVTNVVVAGFDTVYRIADFGGELLNKIAAAGVWIITTDSSGAIYTRHQLTTDMSDVMHKEDSVIAAFDSISYRTLSFFVNSGYIGKRNITNQLLAQLNSDLAGVFAAIKFETSQLTIGPMVLNAVINSLVRHPTLLDTVTASVTVTLPAPFNNFDITLTATV